MDQPLARHPAVLGHEAAKRVDELGSLTHQQIAGPEHCSARLLRLAFTDTNRMLGRCAASQIASASAASFFWRLTNGFT